MIGKLRGMIDLIADDYLLIDVGGVGYVIYATQRNLRQLPAAGETVTLWIETQVREDAITLYGFTSQQEQAWFRLLITVQGVAAKMALALLSSFTPQELATIIAAQDKTALCRAKGVGPKLAARILTELKDKAPGIALSQHVSSQLVAPSQQTTAPANDDKGASIAPTDASPDLLQDAVSALVHLGYGQSEAFTTVASLQRSLPEDATVETVIPLALKQLSAG